VNLREVAFVGLNWMNWLKMHWWTFVMSVMNLQVW